MRSILMDGISAADRFVQFRWALSRVHCPADIRCDSAAEFTGRMEYGDVGALTLMLLSTQAPGGVDLVRGPALIRRCDPGSYRLVLNRRGTSEVTHNHRRTVLSPGDFTLIDTSRPYDARHGSNIGQWLIVNVPRELLPMPAKVTKTFAGARWCGRTGIGALLSSIVTTMAQDAEQYRPADALRVSTVMLDLLNGLLAHELEADTALPPDSVQQAMFHRILIFIEHRLDDPELSPVLIAAAHHISPRTLQRLFESAGATAVGWIRNRRLDRCRRDMTNPMLADRPIQAIAERWGFLSATSFSRAFRDAYHTTPTEYRRHFTKVRTDAAR